MSQVTTQAEKDFSTAKHLYDIKSIPFDHMSEKQFWHYSDAADLLDDLVKYVDIIKLANPKKTEWIFKHVNEEAIKIFKLINGINGFNSKKFLASRFDLVNGRLAFKDHKAGMPNPIQLKTIIEKLGVEEE